MPVGFVVSAVLLLEAQPVIVFGDSSSKGEIWVSEKNGTTNKATNQSEFCRSSQEHGPIEVVVSPIFLEVNALFDNTLLLGGVEATCVDNRQLEPGSSWISVTETTLVESPEFVGELESLRPVSELVSSEVSKEIWVGLSGLFLKIPLIEIVLPSLYLSLCVRHFNKKL